jgi:hypothetical protein
MTEDLLAFIDQHGLKEPTLIGHSMYGSSETAGSPDSRLMYGLQGRQDGHVGSPALARDGGQGRCG